MTWSLSATLTEANYYDRWRTFFDNNVNGLTAWTVSAHPGGSSSNRSIRYDYTDAVDGTTRSYYYWFSGVNLYEDAVYTTTPGDTGTNTTNATAAYNTTTLSWKVWTSDVNPGSIIMTAGKAVIFTWFEPTSIYQPFTYSWAAGDHNREFVLFPRMTASYQYGCNIGYSSSSSSEHIMSQDVTGNLPSAYYGSTLDRYYTAYHLTPQGKQLAPFLYYSQSDVLVHVPPVSGYSFGMSDDVIAGTGSTVFDGTKYYLRSNSNLLSPSYLFDFGTSEPDFSS